MGKTCCGIGARFRRGKHPHGRGEDRHAGERRAAHVGNTPTGVGKTILGPALSANHEKHPHGRGEDGRCNATLILSQETPPRAWGRLGKLLQHCSALGNTPTGVGKTKGRVVPGLDIGKHPHGRGEDGLPDRQSYSTRETPPRAWGRPDPDQRPEPRRGNTPTGVGKTQGGRPVRVGTGKHPHGRGEDAGVDTEVRRNAETPPRAWGRPAEDSHHRVKIGNTPTGVGKTGSSRRRMEHQKKHPHGRGEDEPSGLEMGDDPETPPRAWGRPSHHRRAVAERGNTPTGVGKTYFIKFPEKILQKHPHGRGEDAR